MAWIESQKNYARSVKGREARKRYQQSEKGKAARVRYLAKRQAKLEKKAEETVASLDDWNKGKKAKHTSGAVATEAKEEAKK